MKLENIAFEQKKTFAKERRTIRILHVRRSRAISSKRWRSRLPEWFRLSVDPLGRFTGYFRSEVRN